MILIFSNIKNYILKYLIEAHIKLYHKNVKTKCKVFILQSCKNVNKLVEVWNILNVTVGQLKTFLGA